LPDSPCGHAEHKQDQDTRREYRNGTLKRRTQSGEKEITHLIFAGIKDRRKTANEVFYL
jgi:hypothetical protein